MSIWIGKETRLVVQGITGRDGSFHARQAMESGTNMVAGVTPGKGGQQFEEKVPVFNTVADAVRGTGANCSVIYRSAGRRPPGQWRKRRTAGFPWWSASPRGCRCWT